MSDVPDWPHCPYDHHPFHREIAAINQRLEQLMSDFTALDAAVASLASTVTDVAGVVSTLTSASTADQPAIDAATASIETALTSLKALIPAPPAPLAAKASVYTFAGDPAVTPIDATEWILSTTEETVDVPPRALYTYRLDVAPGDTLGSGVGGVWVLYTGAVQPKPAA